jgi:hypothetical protein
VLKGHKVLKEVSKGLKVTQDHKVPMGHKELRVVFKVLQEPQEVKVLKVQ